MKNILSGAYDLHVHAAPDVVPRKARDIELANSIIENGMKGFVTKSHYFDTSGRAALIREMFPECNAIGAVVLNNTVGGLNPDVVEMSARCGTKVVWFPTMDAQNMWDYLVRNDEPLPSRAGKSDPSQIRGIRIVEDGKLKSIVYDILDLIAKYDMVLATGHISIEESLALFKVAQSRGVKRLMATHVEFAPTYASIDEQKEFIKYGAKIEHNARSIVTNEFSLEDMKKHIEGVGAQNVVLSSDLGQNNNPFPMDGFAQFLEDLMNIGISEKDIEKMIVTNTAELVE
jgi:hypothetical protein